MDGEKRKPAEPERFKKDSMASAYWIVDGILYFDFTSTLRV